ncbi:piggyBac transposable element-derived protein 3-like [Erpetoichthys calabaricus]|uniref:piggyBac transposable element-derived protein 3-like n=1 Tax=Erpetoichthys calabaricus TaxID=27687 RepID=UPI00109FEB71|nr:piggyBac transposable element-derived protein 3-like [Erpetoichthys calabaricus]
MDCGLFYGKRRIYDLDGNGTDSDKEPDANTDDTGSEYAPDYFDLDELEDLVVSNDNTSEDELETSVVEVEESIPITTSSKPSTSRNFQSKRIPLWRHISGDGTARPMPEWLGQIDSSGVIKRPVEYFRHFFSKDIITHIVDQSNLYAIQQNPNKPLALSSQELEQFLGTLLAMSMVKLSNSRLYWKSKLNCPIVSEVISRDRWEEIKSKIHFNDNSQIPLPNEKTDKLFKIRPLIDHLQKKFREIPMPQMLCVDEQIVPFKGRSSMKQYIPSKPHKWGYKLFVLCDDKGIMYDFFIYSEKIEPVLGEPDLGASSNVVLKLAQSIPVGLNHLLYFDNWFTSLPSMTTLAKKKIFSLGTVRINRLPGIKLIKDKDLMKRGKGSHQEVTALVEDTEVRVVKWADDRVVNLMSTFASAEPKANCKRYDKKTKQTITIDCPAIVKTYNQFMGGVDLMDSLIALYRIHIRSKKYYHKLFFHFIDVTVVNSWLLYRRDCESLQLPKKKIQSLQEFKMSITEALLLEEKSNRPTKRGRPSTSSTDVEFANKKRRGPATKSIPGSDIRLDGLHHYPEVTNRGRCKNIHGRM